LHFVQITTSVKRKQAFTVDQNLFSLFRVTKFASKKEARLVQAEFQRMCFVRVSFAFEKSTLKPIKVEVREIFF
jgi:hypothetical protein